jgi:hypothetical protein
MVPEKSHLRVRIAAFSRLGTLNGWSVRVIAGHRRVGTVMSFHWSPSAIKVEGTIVGCFINNGTLGCRRGPHVAEAQLTIVQPTYSIIARAGVAQPVAEMLQMGGSGDSPGGNGGNAFLFQMLAETVQVHEGKQPLQGKSPLETPHYATYDNTN